MSLKHILLSEINEAQLQALKEKQVSGIKDIDYKQTLIGKAESDCHEFASDVISFANSSGGDIVFGIAAENDRPRDICGLQDIDPDAEIRRLEQIIVNSISPRIFGVSTKIVVLANGLPVIIVRVPKSYASPHAVTVEDNIRFYCRDSHGKHSMKVGEIRTAFELTLSLRERIRSFRAERIASIVAGETPVALIGEARLVLHILPLNAFDIASRYDLKPFFQHFDKIPTISNISNFWHKYNFDGLLSYAKSLDTPDSYAQLYGNGIIEAVDASILNYTLTGLGQNVGSVMYTTNLENRILKTLPKYLNTLKELAIDLPMLVMLSLTGVKGFVMESTPHTKFSRIVDSKPTPIDRSILLVPEVLLDNFATAPETLMKPIFDSIWNAVGYEGSRNYDSNGKWIGRG
jgi:hypothetical protein